MVLNFTKYGSGTPLIIMHGLLGSSDNWMTLAKKFSQYFEVFNIDIRNHGRSPHATEHSIKLMCDDLSEFIIQNHINNPFLLGHSMGGKVAMQFALNNPDIVSKLVIVDIGPKKYKPVHDELFLSLSKIDLSQISSISSADEALKNAIPDFAERQLLIKNIKKSTEQGYEWRINLEVLKRDYHLILNEVSGEFKYANPALFIKGEQSNYIIEEDKKDILNWFPKTEFKTIENAGHWVHASNPTDFYDAVLDFLLA